MFSHIHVWIMGLAAALVASQALAQDAPAEDAIVQEEEVAGVELEQVVMTDEMFDQWVLGGGGHRANIEQRLEDLLPIRMEAVERVCQLTPLQREQLTRAARGDIHRFLTRVEEVRGKFHEVRHDQNRMNQIWQEIHPLQEQMRAGVFGKDSLYTKVLANVLTPEQQSAYRADEESRRTFAYHARILATLKRLDTKLPMRQQERTKLLEWLRQTEPPKEFGQYDDPYVLWQISKIPEDKLKPLFDQKGWERLQQHLQDGRAMGRVFERPAG